VKHVRVVENKIVVLDCPAEGIPFPNVTWFKDEEPIELNERVRLLMSDRRLEVSLARESDSGWFTCMADNVVGSANMNFNLTVIGNEFRHLT